MSEKTYLLSIGQIFTLFFVMMGPLRLIGPFTLATQNLGQKDLKKLVTSSTLIATACLIVSGVLGSQLLLKWHIEPQVMLLAGGILFFIAAIKPFINSQNDDEEIKDTNRRINPSSAGLELILTPYGIATTIVLVTVGHDIERILIIFLCLFSIMLLNFVSMIFGREILQFTGPLPMKILNSSLGVLQLGLAAEIIVKSLQYIKG